MTDTPAESATPGADRLTLLYRLTQTFNSSLDLDQVLNLVIDEVITAIQAERGFLMLQDAAGNLAFRTARGLDQLTIDEPEFQVSRGVVETVAQQGVPLLTSNAQSDYRLNERQSVMFLGLRSVLCVPLQIKGKVIGVIYVDNRIFAGIFTDDDMDLLTAIASSAAVAIENARLYQIAVEKGRMERELQMAREVQRSLLPRRIPRLTGWEFAAHWLPARQVAGDFYDFLTTDQGQLGLMVADVADKGMPAALFMTLTRSVLRASVLHTPSPATGIAQANRLICADATNGMFVTLFYAQIHPAHGQLTYVNAGHNPALHYSAAGGQVTRLTRTAMALGIDDKAHIEQQVIQLQPGDVVVLYTDGMTEAMDDQNAEFGEERLKALLQTHHAAKAGEIVTVLQQAVEAFTRGAAPFDDVTLLVVKRLG